MTINVAETVRKLMGWCPNASIAERKTRVEYDLASTNAGLPVKKWIFDLLILGHVCALMFSFLFILPMSVYNAFDLYNSSYLALNYGNFLADITLSVASMLFSVTTVVLIYSALVFKRSYSKLCYFNVILLSGLFIAIIVELSLFDNHRLEEGIYWAFVFALLPLIPSLMNIRFNKRYGEQKIVTEGLGLVELIKRAMGWCPQQDFESMQSQIGCTTHAHLSNVDQIWVRSKQAERMDVPLHGTGKWGIKPVAFALYIFLMAIFLFDIMNRTFVSYLAVVLTTVVFITILFLYDRKKMTFDSEMIRIQAPFLKSSNFQMKDVTSVRTVDNIVYKQMKWAYVVYIAGIVFFGVKAAWDLYYLMAHPMGWEGSTNIGISMLLFFISIFLFYRSYRRSRYPQVIKIDVGNKNITLSPRNEFEYGVLKEKLGQ